MATTKPSTTSSTYYSNIRPSHPSSQSSNRTLAERIDPAMPATAVSGVFCRNCQQNNHTTDNCRWLGQPKCNKCGWFGHVGAVKLLRHGHVIPFVIYFIFDYLCHVVMLLISQTLSYHSTSVYYHC